MCESIIKQTILETFPDYDFSGEEDVASGKEASAKAIRDKLDSKGAYLNQNEPLQVGQQSNIGDAIVAMGSPPGAESLQMSLRGIQVLMPKVRTIRMLGSAALMLAWVANGRLTSYWEYDLSCWESWWCFYRFGWK
mmetsp:Transcript_20958/g.29415  ORF Transcript_20958/g.29415 Transcript_20958/m.29415 type:complete len:136 (+) Transcript_20958:210-617(+)